MTSIDAYLLIVGLTVLPLAVGVVVYAVRRADQARRSAEASRIAAERAARYCAGLIELLADLSPSARRAFLSAQANAPLVALSRLHTGRLHGQRGPTRFEAT